MVLGFNIGLSQEISYCCIIKICIVFQAQSLIVPNVSQQMYQSLKVYLTRIWWKLFLLVYCKTQVHYCRQWINQWSYASYVVNIIFSSKLLNLFITGGDILFCKDHVSCQCCLIKLVAYLKCGSIQVFCNNRSGISGLIHINGMILKLRNSYWHEPICISQEVHMESISQGINKPFYKIFIFIPIETIINIR